MSDTSPALGSILLGSPDPARLRAWYERAFGVVADADGFLWLGGVGLLVDGRADVAPVAAEPARVILNVHVADARAMAGRLDAAGVRWLAPLEYREPVGAWFATAVDPDGNYLQLVELTEAHRARPAGHGGIRLDSLADGSTSTRLPAQDLERARRFYADRLGLEPAESRPGGLRYQCRQGSFSLFLSSGRPSGDHTQMAFSVEDLDAVVAELRRRGLVFEDVDAPGLRTVDGIVEVEGNYPSAGGGSERAAWFRDSEGNLLGVGQSIPRAAAGGQDDASGHVRRLAGFGVNLLTLSAQARATLRCAWQRRRPSGPRSRSGLGRSTPRGS